MTLTALSQLIKIELINQKELEDLCQEVHNKIDAMKHAVKLLELMMASVTSLQDYISNCKAFLAMHQTIGEAIHSVQTYSIVSSRVEGMELGRWRIRFPHPFTKWLNFSFANKKKQELDSLLHKLENVFESILSLQNGLINLGERFSPTHQQNHEHEETSQFNLINSPNQSEWENELMKKRELINSLNLAKEWNLDSFLILRNLIEWDYKHRFSVGERSEDDDENELKGVFVESPLNDEQFYYNGIRIQGNKVTVSSSKRNPRSKRLLVFTLFFICILLMCFVFVI